MAFTSHQLIYRVDNTTSSANGALPYRWPSSRTSRATYSAGLSPSAAAHRAFPTSVLFPDELDPAPNTMDSWCVFKHGSHFIGILALMNEKSNEGKTDL